MKLIKFPGPGGSKPLKGGAVRVKQEAGNGLSVGRVSFTCVACNETANVDFRGMIFRTVDFFCAACGAFHRMTNPGFAAPASRTPTPSTPSRPQRPTKR